MPPRWMILALVLLVIVFILLVLWFLTIYLCQDAYTHGEAVGRPFFTFPGV